MNVADLDGLPVHYTDEGDPAGRPLVFANSLGTDLRVWDAVLPLLPAGLRLVRYDLRGHGLTGCPDGPYKMGTLVSDAERLIEHLGLRGVTFVGLSIGGMIAQGLAVKRPDLVSAMVLSNTAAKIGTAPMWQQRIDTVLSRGIAALSDAVLERWFAPEFREGPALPAWRAMLERQPAQGYAGCCAAIAGADLMAATAQLTLPTLAVACDRDGSTPPDLVRETAALIPGSRVELIRGAGHLPPVEAPRAFAAALADFLADTAVTANTDPAEVPR